MQTHWTRPLNSFNRQAKVHADYSVYCWANNELSPTIIYANPLELQIIFSHTQALLLPFFFSFFFDTYFRAHKCFPSVTNLALSLPSRTSSTVCREPNVTIAYCGGLNSAGSSMLRLSTSPKLLRYIEIRMDGKNKVQLAIHTGVEIWKCATHRQPESSNTYNKVVLASQ